MKNERTWKKGLTYLSVSVVSLAIATLLGWGCHKGGFQDANIILFYIMAVLITARFTQGYVVGIVTSVAAIFTFNYFFTEPYYTFKVDNPDYPVTFVIMTLTAFVTSALTSRVKESEKQAREKERETQALYQFTSHLTEAENVEEISKIVVKAVSGWFECKAGCQCFGEQQKPEPFFLQQESPGKIVRRRQTDTELEQRIRTLHKPWEEGEEFWDWPVYGGREILAIVRIPVEKAISFRESEKRFLYSVIECTALAMARARSQREQIRSRQETMQERYRGNLLRAISHDLRTPLAGIMGTSEMIMGMSEETDPRYGLSKEINEDAHWLHALVENILSLTKLQEGSVKLNRQLEAAEEVIAGAVRQVESRTFEHEITVKLPEEVMMVPMEGKLIMQVLINLLDNAVKHTDPQKEISVSLKKDEKRGMAVFTVADEGEGIAAKDLPNIFQIFYTSQIKPVDAKKGIGLGLSICESIVKAHGGSIIGRNRTDGPGAEFIFTLPLTMSREEEENEQIS